MHLKGTEIMVAGELTQLRQKIDIKAAEVKDGTLLLTAYEFMLKYEPKILDILYDPKIALLTDGTRALAVAARLGVQGEWRAEYRLTHGIFGVAVPAFPVSVWEIVYN